MKELVFIYLAYASESVQSFWTMNAIVAALLWYVLHLIFVAIQRIAGRKWFYKNIYLNTPHWKFTRWLKMLVSGKYCRVCEGEYYLQVHHLTYKHIWWEFIFLWDLMVLCDYDHKAVHKISPKKHPKRGRRR